MDVQPFTVHVPEETLVDLRERLARTRWPGELPDTGWDYGSNLAHGTCTTGKTRTIAARFCTIPPTG